MFKYENKCDLPTEEVLDAIRQGVRDAFYEALDQNKIMEAIERGVREAFPEAEYIEQAITKGTTDAFSE